MKDVSLKPDSLRTAAAIATLRAPAHCIDLLRSGDTEKGDPLKTARVAGILAACAGRAAGWAPLRPADAQWPARDRVMSARRLP